MRLSTSKSKNAILFYIIKSTYIDKKHSTKIVEKLGTLEEVKIKANGEDPYIWAKRYAEELTKKEKDGMVIVTMQLKQDSLTNIVRRQAFEIYMDVFTANEINLKRHPERKNERLTKQLHAIELCNRHLAAIQLCRKKFHLSYKRIKYWGKKTIDLREVIERWHDSDKDRFKEI